MKVIITIPSAADSRKKSWRKLLTRVDRSKANGYAFEGEWLRPSSRAELEVGSFVLAYDEPGSMKNWWPLVRLFKVTATGLEEVWGWKGHVRDRSWALAVRDEIARILASAEGPQELTQEEQALVGALKALPPERLELVLAALRS